MTMSNDFVDFESDQEYSVLLKSCLDQELNLGRICFPFEIITNMSLCNIFCSPIPLDVLELDEEVEDESDEETDYQDESALIESCYFSKLNEHLTKHSNVHAIKCQDPKQNKKRSRDRTRTSSQGDIDVDTRMTLFKFMKKSVLKDNYGVINKGKKSLILHACGGV